VALLFPYGKLFALWLCCFLTVNQHSGQLDLLSYLFWTTWWQGLSGTITFIHVYHYLTLRQFHFSASSSHKIWVLFYGLKWLFWFSEPRQE